MNSCDKCLNDKDPDQIVTIILKQVSDFINEEHGQSLQSSRFFNVQRLSYLVGSQFVTAGEARKSGLIIEDCEMCDCFDRQIHYCSHYNQVLRMEKDPFYYHKALCPALVLK